MAVEIQGNCDKRFERVREAFAENFARRDEVGASVAVTIDGKPVIDLWGGHADRARTRPWTRDTLANVWSTTKGLTAICAHRLVDQGKIDLDAHVSRYWPEFAQAGKEKMPVRYLLSHQAGLCAISRPLGNDDLFKWDVMCSALAAQKPWWEPGARHGYHALTFGWLVGEVVRRTSASRTFGDYFRNELAGPLKVDCHIGLAPEDDARVAEMIAAPPPGPDRPDLIAEAAKLAEAAKNPESMLAKAFTNPPNLLSPGTVNTRQWRAAEIPAANGHTNARALARIYGALARGGELDGVRVLTREGVARCHAQQAVGPDALLMLSTRFGLGFMMSQEFPGSSMGPGAHTFGHPGAGGSLGFADPDAKIGFGYVMNQMAAGILISTTAEALITALYASIK